MKSIFKRALMASAGAMAFAISVSAQAADKVNVRGVTPLDLGLTLNLNI